MTRRKILTRDEALQMQNALLAEYTKPDFQEKLRAVLEDACAVEEKAALDLQLRKMREEVGSRFGFEASPEGVEKSIELFTPELRADPEIANKCSQINMLLYPNLQKDQKQTNQIKKQVELAIKLEAEKEARKKELLQRMQLNRRPYVVEKVGRKWKVIGGASKKGIVVRKGEELSSAELPMRLHTGSIVEEIELIGDRLHYQKISGEGPNIGWVSIMVKGATLLQAVRDTEKVELTVPAIEAGD